MKKATIYDDIHREVKAEAATEGRTLPNMFSELLEIGLSVFRDKKRGTPAKPAKRKPASK